ncbi:MAG TPA: hypothetical protein VKT49_00480 [Bryobacteraceae bacterium]|nr:hypothetical protein [Bryobacteraceae bacterium]
MPVSVMLPATIGEVLRPQPVPILSDNLFETGGESLGVYLFALPTCAAIGYSIGMALARGDRKPFATSTVACIAVCALSVFVIAAALLNRYENRALDRWSRVRTVLGAGLTLTTEARELCASPFSSGGTRIESATYLETLEHRVCSPDDRATTFAVERVRVLTGPHANLEGWVGSYGLLGP